MPLVAGQYTRATDGTHIETDGVKRYVALLSQTGTDAPVATVLENSLGGTLVWSRADSGSYNGTLVGAFPAGRVYAVPYAGMVQLDTNAKVYSIRRTSDDTVNVVTFSADEPGNLDGQLDGNPIEIRVYPA